MALTKEEIMHMKRTGIRRLVAVGLVIISVMSFGARESAQAIPVTVQFAGAVFNANSPLNTTVLPGTLISGSYTFESTTPDQFIIGDPLNVIGSYALSNFSVSFLGRTYSMATHSRPNEIRIEDNNFADAYRVLLIPSGLEQAIIGPSINGLIPTSFQFNIFGNMFTSAALPLVPPPLPGNPTFNITFTGGGIVAGIQGRLTSLTAVPEPSSLMLMEIGLLGLIGYEMRRRLTANLRSKERLPRL
ncbi:MAG: PEP-CTERM sorting domain-containing protein [Nitrospira sp.]|nr:PEP-CTERM sorting domain-containing protein [Nitrospira sp.]